VKTTKKKIKFGHILLILLLIFLVYNILYKTIENIKLARIGIKTKGVVVDKRVVGGKGTIELDVKYFVENKFYEGTISNENWNLNDSVDLVCLSSEPTIVRSNRFIKSEYSWVK
jgi:hypothetical protein